MTELHPSYTEKCCTPPDGAVWVVNHDAPEGIASLRYMALYPARSRGEPVARFLAGMNATAFLDRWRPSVLVLTKAFEPSIVDLVLAARQRSIRVIAVLCDDRSDRPRLQDLDAKVASLADDIVLQTKSMARHVLQTFGRDSTIIEEPYEMPAGVPRFDPGESVKLLWYGRLTNHDTLSSGMLPLVNDRDLSFKLVIVTDSLSTELVTLARQISSRDGASVELQRWTLQRQAEALADTDLVIIPSLDRRDKMVKGHNRLVEAIRAGVPALAYPLPAYQELSEFCWCGDDLRVGLKWVLGHREAAVDRVRWGQSYIEQRFSMESINVRWQQLFDAPRATGTHG